MWIRSIVPCAHERMRLGDQSGSVIAVSRKSDQFETGLWTAGVGTRSSARCDSTLLKAGGGHIEVR